MNGNLFGKFLCSLRMEKELSQTQLGDMLGVTDEVVSKWENGRAKPNTDLFPQLSEIFGVTVEELFACRRRHCLRGRPCRPRLSADGACLRRRGDRLVWADASFSACLTGGKPCSASPDKTPFALAAKEALPCLKKSFSSSRSRSFSWAHCCLEVP